MTDTAMTLRACADRMTPAVGPARRGVVRNGATGLRILSAIEETAFAHAGAATLAATSPTTAPFLVSHKGGHPARIGFGDANMAPGRARVAAPIRAIHIARACRAEQRVAG